MSAGDHSRYSGDVGGSAAGRGTWPAGATVGDSQTGPSPSPRPRGRRAEISPELDLREDTASPTYQPTHRHGAHDIPMVPADNEVFGMGTADEDEYRVDPHIGSVYQWDSRSARIHAVPGEMAVTSPDGAQALTRYWQTVAEEDVERYEYNGEDDDDEADDSGGRYADDSADLEDGHMERLAEERRLSPRVDSTEGDGDNGEEEEDAHGEDPEPEVLSPEALAECMKARHLMDVVGLGSSGTVSAVCTVSSAKHSSGVACLLDWGSPNTYWQSDGPLPHTLSVCFQRLTPVEAVCVLLCYSEDESYTPKDISVRAGTHDGDMAEVASGYVVTPHGWVVLDVGGGLNGRTKKEAGQTASALTEEEYRVWCTRLEVVFKENHENGRDCHVRGVRILGPSAESAFNDPAFTQHLVLR